MKLPRRLEMVFVGISMSALLVTHTLAQESSPSCSTTTATILNAVDAMALSPCTTFTGAIQLSTGVTGAIALDALQTLNGGLFIQSAQSISSFSAGQLESVSGPVYVEDLPNLETLNFSKLRSINNQLRLVNLPLLSQPGMESTLSTCPLVTVSSTGLTTLDGIDPIGVTKGLNVTYNSQLRGNLTMSMSSTRATLDTTITIMYNGPGLAASFPNLATAQSIDLSNLSDVSLPLLTDAFKMVLQGNTFQAFAAPKLESVANASTARGVLVRDNLGLANIHLSALRRTGGLSITNNNRIKELTLEKFESARGKIELRGSFENVSFPDLLEVQTFVIKTSSSKFDCSPFEAYKQQSVIEQLDCGRTDQRSSSSSPPGISTAAKVGIGVGVGAVLMLVVASGFVYRRYRQRRAARGAEQELGPGSTGVQKAMHETQEIHGMGFIPSNLPTDAAGTSPVLADKRYRMQDGRVGREANELEAASEVYELPEGREAAELSGDGRGGH